MNPKQVDRRQDLIIRLQGLELKTASLIMKRAKELKRLKKLKEYTTLKKCTFRDKRIKQLIGEKNG
jgi:hypothetical protein